MSISLFGFDFFPRERLIGFWALGVNDYAEINRVTSNILLGGDQKGGTV